MDARGAKASRPKSRSRGLTLGRSAPRGFLRWLLRAPRWLYRARLGFLLGHRLLLLTHRGRRSGKVHQTVLEVVAYDRASDESAVVAGWGEASAWYRNLETAPALEIETGGRRYVPVQRLLAPAETYAICRKVVETSRWEAPFVRRVFGLRFDGSDLESEQARRLRGATFRPPPG